MARQGIYFLLVTVGMIWTGVGDATAQNGISLKKIGRSHFEQGAAYAVLAEIAEKTGIAIGVDAVQPPRESAIAFDFPGGTVAELLNMFVSKAPDYSWEENEHGIIHVSRNNEHVSLLDVVMYYPGAAQRTRKQIWEDLANRPEISTWLQANHCVRSELFGGWEFRGHNDPISVESGLMTVSQLLDKVAVRSGVNYWAVLRSSSGSDCRIGMILW